VDDCCATETSEAVPCPECGATGPVVGELTVRPHCQNAPDGPWQFCANEACNVIFHLGDDIVDAEGVMTQVGHKATDKPTPVCFCFAHTLESLAADFAANNRSSTAQIEIKAAVASGLCKCEHLNPSGKCCLPDVHRALRTIASDQSMQPR